MRSYVIVTYVALAVISLLVIDVDANWDEATGFVHGYKPSPAWLGSHKPLKCSPNIQVAECAHNTRNAFPAVQFMAVFTVDHSKDTYHGCAYGSCCAFQDFPSITDLVPAPADSHIFVWHKLGGFPGLGTNPIANPKTGAFGWEDGKNGKYVDGPPNRATYTPAHDANYPGFKLPAAWPAKMPMAPQTNKHPSCGRVGEPNKDPNPTGASGGGNRPNSATSGQSGKAEVKNSKQAAGQKTANARIRRGMVLVL